MKNSNLILLGGAALLAAYVLPKMMEGFGGGVAGGAVSGAQKLFYEVINPIQQNVQQAVNSPFNQTALGDLSYSAALLSNSATTVAIPSYAWSAAAAPFLGAGAWASFPGSPYISPGAWASFPGSP